MTSPFRALRIALATLAALGAPSAFAGGATRPVVVELFTSQGCSSCPPADVFLGKLAQRPDVIAISLPITYWDMLGWKDTLASDANTRRQKAYAAAMGRGGVYTPQIIVDGAADVVGSRIAAVEAAIAQRIAAISSNAAVVAVARANAARAAADVARAEGLAAPRPMASAAPMPAAAPAPPPAADPVVPVDVSETPREMRIAIGAAPGNYHATVWMFHLRSSVSVNVVAGENEGHTITYHNVVGDLKAVGLWKGKALTLTLPRAALAGLPHDGVAVVVQQNGYGHVVGAAYIARPDYYAAQ
jgi:hypothetical protein